MQKNQKFLNILHNIPKKFRKTEIIEWLGGLLDIQPSWEK
mgnify:CR=1 FL=1